MALDTYDKARDVAIEMDDMDTTIAICAMCDVLQAFEEQKIFWAINVFAERFDYNSDSRIVGVKFRLLSTKFEHLTVIIIKRESTLNRVRLIIDGPVYNSQKGELSAHIPACPSSFDLAGYINQAMRDNSYEAKEKYDKRYGVRDYYNEKRKC